MGDYSDEMAPEDTANSGRTDRTRLLLRCLAAEGGETDIVQLSVACARELYDQPVTTIPPETRRQLYRNCRESVIEILANQNLVKYSPADGSVRLAVPVDPKEMTQ